MFVFRSRGVRLGFLLMVAAFALTITSANQHSKAAPVPGDFCQTQSCRQWLAYKEKIDNDWQYIGVAVKAGATYQLKRSALFTETFWTRNDLSEPGVPTFDPDSNEVFWMIALESGERYCSSVGGDYEPAELRTYVELEEVPVPVIQSFKKICVKAKE